MIRLSPLALGAAAALLLTLPAAAQTAAPAQTATPVPAAATAAAPAPAAAPANTPAPPAADATTVVLTAPGVQPVTLDPQALAAMPMLEQDISFESHGGEKGHYRGVLLWSILTADTNVEDDVKTSLRNTVMVIARDGHQVAFSVGDLAPDFGNDPVMLAVEQDGKPLEQGLRVVVPGDKRGARNIRDVTRIELR